MAEPDPTRPTGDALPGTLRRPIAGGDDDLFVREEPLRIVAGDGEVLTMRTPGDDEALALGFLLSEGVIDGPAAITGFRFEAGDVAASRPDTLAVATVPGATLKTRGRLTRTHEVRPSCGACGLVDADQLLEEAPPLLPGVPHIGEGVIARLVQSLEAHQPLFAATGACHGALIADAAGRVLGSGEDVGRHNALDKAIGRAARTLQDRDGSIEGFSQAVAVLSGRAGYDLVMKALRLRIPILLSVSAPSALGYDLCATAGATLIGFARGSSYKVYCGGERLRVGPGGEACPSAS